MLSIGEVLQRVSSINSTISPSHYYVNYNNAEIVGVWKWQDARFFNLRGVTDEVKVYEFHVTLDAKGKWHERSVTANTVKSADIKNGKITIGSSNFSGASGGKQFEIGFGKNRATGQTGAIGFKLDTALIKMPLRDLLKLCGYKKAIF